MRDDNAPDDLIPPVSPLPEQPLARVARLTAPMAAVKSAPPAVPAPPEPKRIRFWRHPCFWGLISLHALVLVILL